MFDFDEREVNKALEEVNSKYFTLSFIQYKFVGYNKYDQEKLQMQFKVDFKEGQPKLDLNGFIDNGILTKIQYLRGREHPIGDYGFAYEQFLDYDARLRFYRSLWDELDKFDRHIYWSILRRYDKSCHDYKVNIDKSEIERKLNNIITDIKKARQDCYDYYMKVLNYIHEECDEKYQAWIIYLDHNIKYLINEGYKLVSPEFRREIERIVGKKIYKYE